jgi:hypothetical protein
MARHHHVGEHHVVLVRIRSQFRQRVGGIADQRGDITEFGQRVGREGSDLGIILDHENRHAVAIDLAQRQPAMVERLVEEVANGGAERRRKDIDDPETQSDLGNLAGAFAGNQLIVVLM